MITTFPSDPKLDSPPVWIDLLEATPSEVDEAIHLTGLRVPSREALSEIESSSRAYFEKGAIYLSMPLITPVEDDHTVLMPVGFVVTNHTILTVRFAASAAFDAVIKSLADETALTAGDVFGRLLEAVVDRAADRLEHTGGELDKVSLATFRQDIDRSKSNSTLRGILRKIGKTGDRLSQVRDTLLGLDRITAFIVDTPHCGFDVDIKSRLKAVHGDVASLSSYEEHLATKVQFLLDATLGFINIEQNDIVKILTVVSVVGVPPVLIAGVYGMNFKNIPELNWAWGYPYSLALMVVSAIVPYLWFKWRRWL